VKENKVLFPICWSYKDPDHLTGWKRDSGLGMVAQQRNTVIPYIDNKCWGREDDHNYAYYNQRKLAVRTYYGDSYVHQWHPEEIKHIYYK
jgi:hypothetical protein